MHMRRREFLAAGYEFKDGLIAVGNAPGLGLRVDEKLYEMKCKKAEVRVE